ncbi:MAG: SpaA isopeptide-forming pilin-related protein [Gallicola sp.]|nr:SpaA isopeptide-forming pilin-related protein [Gallicola sp.]
MENKIKRIVSWIILFTLVLQSLQPLSAIRVLANNVYPSNSNYLSLEVLKDKEGNPIIGQDKISWKVIINKAEQKIEKEEVLLEIPDNLTVDGITEDGQIDLQKASEPIEREDIEYEIDPGQDGVDPKESMDLVNYHEEIKEISLVQEEGKNYLRMIVSETDKTQTFVINTRILNPADTNFNLIMRTNSEDPIYGTEGLKLQSREKIKIPVELHWLGVEGEIPDQTISLKRGDKTLEERTILSGDTQTEFTNLYAKDLAGKKIDYRIEAKELDHYRTTVEGYKVTNQFEKEEKVSQEPTLEKAEEKLNMEKDNSLSVKEEAEEKRETGEPLVFDKDEVLNTSTENNSTSLPSVEDPLRSTLLKEENLTSRAGSEEASREEITEEDKRERRSTVEITTQDFRNQPVEGAFYEITNKENQKEIVNVGPSDKEGKILAYLPYGVFSVKQTMTNQSFSIADKIPDLKVEETTSSFKVYNEGTRLSKVFIKTEDPNGENVEGAAYRLTNIINPEKVYTAREKTDKGVMAEVPQGNYAVTQITEGVGFKRADKISNLLVEKDKEEVVIVNEKEVLSTLMEKEEITDDLLELRGMDTPVFRVMLHAMEEEPLMEEIRAEKETAEGERIRQFFYSTPYFIGYATRTGDKVLWELTVQGYQEPLEIHFTVPEGHSLVEEPNVKATKNEYGTYVYTSTSTPDGKTYKVSTENSGLGYYGSSVSVSFTTSRENSSIEEAVLNATAKEGAYTISGQGNVRYPGPQGTAKISLTDGVGNNLEGRFSVIDSKDKLVGYFNTVNGSITTTLPVGEYKISQVNTPPDGYKMDNDPIKSVSISDNQITTVHFENRRIVKAPIKVHLTEKKTGAGIGDSLFFLYDENDRQINMGRTDVDGNLTFPGSYETGKTYSIKQVEYSGNYSGDYVADQPTNGLYRIDSLMEAGITAEFTNKYPDMNIPIRILYPDGREFDFPNGSWLQVELVDAFGYMVGSKTIHSGDSSVSFEQIKPGIYTVNMIQIASNDYNISESVKVEVTHTSVLPSPVELKLKTAVSSSLTIAFVDQDGNPVNGQVAMGITNSNNESFYQNYTNYSYDDERIFTQSNGQYHSTGIYPDLKSGEKIMISNYYFNSSDYLITDKYLPFENVEYTVQGIANEKVTITLTDKNPAVNINQRIKVELKNKDGTKMLSGGRFLLEKINTESENGKISFIGSTDGDGVLYFNNIPKGSYQLKEIAGPEGYKRTEGEKIIQITGPGTVTEAYTNEEIPPKEIVELPSITPEYTDGTEGVNNGTYPSPYHQANGEMDENALYRNRDNKGERTLNPNYSVPAYSKFRGLDAMGEDHDVIENEKSYLWKYATPTGRPGEYFIDLVVEGKKEENPPSKDIILVLDNSASMATLSNGVQRITRLNEAVNQFVDNAKLSGEIRVGMVNYATDILSTLGPTQDKDKIRSFIPTKAQPSLGGTGGTFTQAALLEAEKLLKDSTAKDKIIILVSDGAPTYSMVINNIGKNTDPDLSPLYGNSINISGDHQKKGTGQANRLFPRTMTDLYQYYSRQRSYDTWDNSLFPVEIEEHNTATVSDAISIKKTGIDIFAIGVELAATATGQTPYYFSQTAAYEGNYLVTKADAEKNLKAISSGEEFYQDVEKASELTAALMNLVPTDKKIVNGILSDPMGEQIKLSMKTESFTPTSPADSNLANGDYFMDASHPDLLFNQGSPILPLVKDGRITIEGLHLGFEEWIRLRYRVNLQTEEVNFTDKFYLTNGKDTLLQPVKTADTTYAFGVPAIRLPLIDIQITKKWMGFKEIPEKATFDIERKLKGAENWEKMDKYQNIELNQQNEWKVLIQDLIRFNNTGTEFDYRVVETTSGNYDQEVVRLDTDEDRIEYNFINKALLGSIYVFKKDEVGRPIRPNPDSEVKPEFALYADKNGEPIQRVALNEDGEAHFEYLENGTYYLKETAAPEGFVINEEWAEVKVEGREVFVTFPEGGSWYGINQNSPGEIALKNERIPSKPKITKVDGEKKLLEEEVTFHIYTRDQYDVHPESGVVTIHKDQEDKPYDTLITSKGAATGIKNYDSGRYAIVESKAPQGYVGLLAPIEIQLEFKEKKAQWEVLETHSNNAFITMESDGTMAISIMNRQVSYPATGGIGTWIFTLGGMLLMGAAYLLERKKNEPLFWKK